MVAGSSAASVTYWIAANAPPVGRISSAGTVTSAGGGGGGDGRSRWSGPQLHAVAAVTTARSARPPGEERVTASSRRGGE